MQRRRGGIAIVILLAIVAVTLIASAQTATGQARRPIVLGVLAALTGGANTVGIPYAEAAKFAADEINSKGGINGRRVQLVIQDNETNPVAGVQAALKLVDADRVDALLCSCFTVIMFPVAQALANKNVVTINNGASTPVVRTLPGHLVTTMPTDDVLGAELARFAYTMGFRRSALLTVSDPYGSSFRQIVGNVYRELGGEIIIDLVAEGGLADYRPEMLRIVDSGAKALLMGTYTGDARLQFRQLTELGWKGIAYKLYPSVTRFHEDPETDRRIFGIEPTWLENDPKGKEWRDRFRKATGKEPGYWHAVGYDATWLAALGVGNAKDSSASGVREAIRSASLTYSGPTGAIKFDNTFVRVNPTIGYYKLVNKNWVRTDRRGRPL